MSERRPQLELVRSEKTFNQDLEFVARCKAVLPEKFHALVDAGDQRIGAALLELSRATIDPVDIVRMIDEGRTDDLRAHAARAAEAGRLYGELTNYPLSEHGHDSDTYLEARGLTH